MFIWERFEVVSPKPHEFLTIEKAEKVVQGVRMENANNVYKSRGLRWANFKEASNKKLSKVIITEKKFDSGHVLIIHEEF